MTLFLCLPFFLFSPHMQSWRSMRRMPASTQVLQHCFAGASNFTISGGQFNAIAGNYIVDNRTVYYGLDRAEGTFLVRQREEG